MTMRDLPFIAGLMFLLAVPMTLFAGMAIGSPVAALGGPACMVLLSIIAFEMHYERR